MRRKDAASLEYRGDGLVVTGADTGEVLAFTVDHPDSVERRLPRSAASTVYRGYGLNHTTGPAVHRIRIPYAKSGRLQTNGPCDPDGCILNLDPSGGSGSGSGGCTAGGVGATSCSVTNTSGSSCSIDCGSGYYACCKNCQEYGCTPTCSCIRQ